jgi:hypothetical protein
MGLVVADNPGIPIGVDPPNSSALGSASDHVVMVSLDLVQPIPVHVQFPYDMPTPAFTLSHTSGTAGALPGSSMLGPSTAGLSSSSTPSAPESSDLVPGSSSVHASSSLAGPASPDFQSAATLSSVDTSSMP